MYVFFFFKIFEMEFLKTAFKKNCYRQGFSPLFSAFAMFLTLECVLLSPQDLDVLSECRRNVLPGGPRRTSHIRTSLTWSTLMASTSSASTGNLPGLPSKSSPDAPIPPYLPPSSRSWGVTYGATCSRICFTCPLNRHEAQPC